MRKKSLTEPKQYVHIPVTAQTRSMFYKAGAALGLGKVTPEGDWNGASMDSVLRDVSDVVLKGRATGRI